MEHDCVPHQANPIRRPPWNKGKLIGPKLPLRPSHGLVDTDEASDGRAEAWPRPIHIDSKLRGCDLVAVRVDDVTPSGYAMDWATIRQSKTGRPVRFELTDQTRMAVDLADHGATDVCDCIRGDDTAMSVLGQQRTQDCRVVRLPFCSVAPTVMIKALPSWLPGNRSI